MVSLELWVFFSVLSVRLCRTSSSMKQFKSVRFNKILQARMGFWFPHDPETKYPIYIHTYMWAQAADLNHFKWCQSRVGERKTICAPRVVKRWRWIFKSEIIFLRFFILTKHLVGFRMWHVRMYLGLEQTVLRDFQPHTTVHSVIPERFPHVFGPTVKRFVYLLIDWSTGFHLCWSIWNHWPQQIDFSTVR